MYCFCRKKVDPDIHALNLKVHKLRLFILDLISFILSRESLFFSKYFSLKNIFFYFFLLRISLLNFFRGKKDLDQEEKFQRLEERSFYISAVFKSKLPRFGSQLFTPVRLAIHSVCNHPNCKILISFWIQLNGFQLHS